MILALHTEDTAVTNEYFERVKSLLGLSPLVYDFQATVLHDKEGLYFFSMMKPYALISATFFGVALSVAGAVFNLPNWFYIFPAIFFIAGFFISPIFYYLIAYRRLRKKGYRGFIRILNPQRSLGVFIRCHNMKS